MSLRGPCKGLSDGGPWQSRRVWFFFRCLQPVVLPVLQVKSPGGKEAFLLNEFLLLLFQIADAAINT